MGGCMRERDRPTNDVTLEVHEEVKPGCTPTIDVSGDTVTVTAAAGDKFIWVETYPYPDQKDNFRWHQQYKHRGHLVASVKLSRPCGKASGRAVQFVTPPDAPL